jgi:hypothetical protein
MAEYTLIIRDSFSGNREILVHSVCLTGIFEQHPKDYFESKTVGATNREALHKSLQEKLNRPKISTDILDHIIHEWCNGIKFYKRNFILSLELPYTQTSTTPNVREIHNSPVPNQTKTPPATASMTNSPTKLVDVKRSGINSHHTNKQEENKQDTKSTTSSQPIEEKELPISSYSATDKFILD